MTLTTSGQPAFPLPATTSATLWDIQSKRPANAPCNAPDIDPSPTLKHHNPYRWESHSLFDSSSSQDETTTTISTNTGNSSNADTTSTKTNETLWAEPAVVPSYCLRPSQSDSNVTPTLGKHSSWTTSLNKPPSSCPTSPQTPTEPTIDYHPIDYHLHGHYNPNLPYTPELHLPPISPIPPPLSPNNLNDTYIYPP